MDTASPARFFFLSVPQTFFSYGVVFLDFPHQLPRSLLAASIVELIFGIFTPFVYTQQASN
jgi:hypothetical protein